MSEEQETETESELQIRQEHLSSLARRIERLITAFAEQHAARILRGQSLHAEAVEQFRDLAVDSRQLVHTVERLEILTGWKAPSND